MSEARLRVHETFHSIQGEGAFTGVQATFVRFQGCSVGCSWCDTKETWDFHGGQERSPEEIVQQIERPHVIFTGGEPAQQPRNPMLALVRSLHREGYFIQVETSGRFYAPWLSEVDWRTVSPKPPTYAIHPDLFSCMDEFKTVVSDDFTVERLPHDLPEGCLAYLQPEGNRSDMLERTLDLLRTRPTWRLSMQTHKFAGLA